ncbi:MAG: GumC family protein [Dysgonomonas sp.]
MRASIVIKTDSSKNGSMMEASIMKAAGMDGLATSAAIDDEIGALASQTLMRSMISELGLNTVYVLKKFPFDKNLYNTSPIVVNYSKYLSDTLSAPIGMKIKVEKGKDMLVDIIYDDNVVNSYKVNQLPQTLNTVCGKFVLDKSLNSTISEKSYKLEVWIIGLNLMAEQYRKNIGVSAMNKRSNIINLSINETNKQKGKDILYKFIELYNIDALDDKNKNAKNSAIFINERIAYISKDLNTIEENVESYKKENNLTDIDAEAKIFLETMGTVQEKNTELEVQLNIVKMIDGYMKDPANKYSLIPSSLGLPEALAKSANEYNSVVLERNKLLRNTSESNPTVLTLNDQLDMMRKNVSQSIEQVRKDLSSTKKDWSGKESEMQSRMQKMPTQEREYVDLQRQQLIKSELYIFLLKKLEEAELTLASNTPKAKIVDSAYNIYKPISPKKFNILIIALVIGIMIPIVIVYLIKVFKFKLTIKEELEEATNVPVIGEICLDKSGERVVVSDGETNSTAELFRLLRTNIQFVLKKEEKVVLITSSISGEGKSFFSLNLALSFSLMKGKKVILVGLDIRNPKLAEYIGVNSKDGITNYLADDDMKAEDIIIPLSNLHPNLYLIPAGPIPPNPSELLLRDRLDSLFEYLRSNFDFILVDSAPVGMVSDTFALDRISDMTLYLYRANYTNKSNLRIAESIVKNGKLKNLSLVMNGTSTKSAYGYGYGNTKKN